MPRDRPASFASLSDSVGDVASLALIAFAAAELDEHALARCLATSLGARAWRVVHRMERGALALSPGRSWIAFDFADDGPSAVHADRLRSLPPAIERASARREHHRAERNELEALRAAIELFAPAVLVVDASLAVLFANGAVRDGFGAGAHLRHVLNDSAAIAALGTRVATACNGASPPAPLLLQLGERDVAAVIVPAAPGLAVIVFADARQPRLPDHDALRVLLRLSRAEAEILRALSAGATLVAIAAERGASVETVRSQVKSMLAKLGLRTQGQAIGQACLSLATLRLGGARA